MDDEITRNARLYGSSRYSDAGWQSRGAVSSALGHADPIDSKLIESDVHGCTSAAEDRMSRTAGFMYFYFLLLILYVRNITYDFFTHQENPIGEYSCLLYTKE